MKEEKSTKLKLKKSQQRNNFWKRPPVIVGIVFGVFVVGFLTWLFISALTAKAEIELNTTFNLPEFANLDELAKLDYGDYTVAIDGKITHSMGSEKKILPTASTAKMILGLMVMEQKPFNVGEKGETLTISNDMFNRYLWYKMHGGSNTRVVIGEIISEYDALMAVFLPSSNNMADALAVWAFGSLEAYRDYANSKLKEWGINDTTVGVDASGFDPSTTSTSSDLAMLGQKVLANPVLKEIVGTAEYEIPVAGKITNTNQTLGRNRIIGVKTGYIGDASGYCLVSGYLEGEHIVTTALLGAPTRIQSFNDSLDITVGMQNLVKEQIIVSAGQTVGYYNSWWTGPVTITASTGLKAIGWNTADKNVELLMDGTSGTLKIQIGNANYEVEVSAAEYAAEPSLGERLSHSFGWSKSSDTDFTNVEAEPNEAEPTEEGTSNEAEKLTEEKKENTDKNQAQSDSSNSENCTLSFGNLMLINPNFPVSISYIDGRKAGLVSVSSRYGIIEGNKNNGDNLLTPEAAEHLNQMVKAYEKAYPGHTFETRSCYRARGTTCGRLCAKTGTSDHHTGLTCDLLDPAYGTSLDTDTYNQHIDWQWLYANSYKYGFIDRFPAEWAGGSMSEPLNVDANGTTGLFETWHYRYVGVEPATEIATGKYNNGKYDSLEHYLKATGKVSDLKNGKCN